VVAAADLLTRSLLRLESAETGMASDRLVLLSLGLPERYADGESLAALLDDVVERLEAVPGLEGATPVNTRPFSGTGGWDVPTFTAEGQHPERAAENPALNLEVVHPGYFAALGIRIERGRAFEDTDDRGAPGVAILSRDVTEALWPGEDPIGRRIVFGGADRRDMWRSVVGVVAPTRYREYADPRPTVYVPASQFFVAARNLVVRSGLPAGAVAERVRAVTRQLDPATVVAGVVPFEDLRRGPLARPRFNALLSAIFALAALVLATGGLYAVVAAWVRQRYPELALRVALGAASRDLRRLVLREGLGVALAGAALGFGAAIATSRVFESLVFEAPAFDLWSPMGAAAALVAAAALACLAPTRLAARLDVVSVLRRH
jgi:predicted permease